MSGKGEVNSRLDLNCAHKLSGILAMVEQSQLGSKDPYS